LGRDINWSDEKRQDDTKHQGELEFSYHILTPVQRTNNTERNYCN
jgi:hypothetical protein